MAKYKPGDRVKKEVAISQHSIHGRAAPVETGKVRKQWTEGEVLAAGRRGHITVRWDGDSKLEALDSARVRPV